MEPVLSIDFLTTIKIKKGYLFKTLDSYGKYLFSSNYLNLSYEDSNNFITNIKHECKEVGGTFYFYGTIAVLIILMSGKLIKIFSRIYDNLYNTFYLKLRLACAGYSEFLTIKVFILIKKFVKVSSTFRAKG